MLKICVRKFGFFSAVLAGLLGVSLVAQAQESSDRFEELEKASKTLSKMSKEERTGFINDVKKFFKDKGEDLTKKDFTFAEKICKEFQKVESSEAGNLYVELGGLLAKSGTKDVADRGKALAGAGRRLGLVGSQMVVTGKTLDEKEFDFATYRGKVVLVDFWATWCGPCVAEMPHLRKVHEKYKDRGFDIVGISFDKTKGALEKFIDSKKIAWTNLFDPKLDMAGYYNVSTIPFTVLVDRDGKVLAVNPNHGELDRLLEKHIATASKSDE